MRVNNPMVMRMPRTNSISPAHQNGQVPTGTDWPSGQPNSFMLPCSVKANPTKPQ